MIDDTTRRGFLLAVGTAATGGFGNYTARDGSPSGQVTVAGPSSRATLLSGVADAFERVHPDVSIVIGETDAARGFRRFADGETDIQYANRPILSDERARVAANDVDYASASHPDGLAAVTDTAEWCSRLADGQHTDRWAADTPVETWSEVDGGLPDVGGAVEPLERDELPAADTTVLVRGVRSHQYAVGFGGVGYYEPSSTAVRSIADPTDARTPIVRLGFRYVDREALTREAVAAFVRFTADADLTDGATYFPISDAGPSATA